MNTVKHTPGPWTNPSDKNIPQHIIHHEGLNGYSTVCYMHLHNDPQLTEANAKLIAAAPELLEALQNVFYQSYDDDTSTEDLMATIDQMRDFAKSAIKKATEAN